MKIRTLLATILALLPGLSFAQVPVPDTPAGRALGAWLGAFNSGERGQLESFAKTHSWGSNVDGVLKWRAETGAYELLEIYAAEQRTIFFRLKPQKGVDELGRVSVGDTDPLEITELGTWRIPPGAKADVVALGAKARASLVERVARAFESTYVHPDVGDRMAAALRKNQARGKYRGARYGIDLARELTNDLRDISHDKHVEVRFSFFAKPVEPPANQPELDARWLASINCGFVKAEHLPPNVGYLKFNMFADPAVCTQTAGAALTFLADSDALVIDLRDNNGGNGEMERFIASYLFDERTHLTDMYSRKTNTTTETWTLPTVPGRKFIGKPVFVLTSKRTFSAAEALGYEIQTLKRGTLIGETTFGGAHPTDAKPIDEHFVARVPFGRSISPVTKGNWEGTGVEPDVKVAADQALDVALKLAAEEIDRKRTSNAAIR